MGSSVTASASVASSASGTGVTSAATGSQTSAPARGRIFSDSPKRSVDFHFNPKELSLKKSYNWKAEANEKQDSPDATFSGGNPGTISLNLLFDTYERSASGQIVDVRTYTEIIFQMAEVDEDSRDASGAAHPGRVTLEWGSLSFQGVITSADITFTLFHSSGVPLRATVVISLMEQGDKKLTAQNPTSMGLSNMRVHRILSGETLPHIAQLHYGDCNRWHEIATANKLTRVRRLTPGQELRIPNV